MTGRTRVAGYSRLLTLVQTQRIHTFGFRFFDAGQDATFWLGATVARVGKHD